MADEQKQPNQANKDREREKTQKGEPGRTPGSAEGDRETVEKSLEEKSRKDSNEKRL